jgi:hypothetical protein
MFSIGTTWPPSTRARARIAPALKPTFTDRVVEGGRSPSDAAVAGAPADSRPTDPHWESVIDRATD